MHRIADVTLILVGTDCAHHDRRVFRCRAKPAENSMGKQSPGAGMIEAADNVADVMEIGGNCRQLLLAAVEPHPLQNVARDVRYEADVAESVLGVANCPKIAIGVSNERLNFRIGFHHIQANGCFAAAGLTIAGCPEWIDVVALNSARRCSATAGNGNVGGVSHALCARWTEKRSSAKSIGRTPSLGRGAPATCVDARRPPPSAKGYHATPRQFHVSGAGLVFPQ